MKNSFKLFLASSLTLFLIGCGSSDSSANVSKSDIKGTWVDVCEVDQNLGTSEQEISLFTDETVQMRLIEFDNLTCNSANDNEILLDFTVNFNYILGDDFTTANGKETTKINLTATGFNVTKGQLAGVPDVIGKTVYTIIYIENKKLYGGLDDTDHNMTSDATRAVTIDFTEPSIKQ